MPGTTSTALPSFSHDQHHETDVAKRKGGGVQDVVGRVEELVLIMVTQAIRTSMTSTTFQDLGPIPGLSTT